MIHEIKNRTNNFPPAKKEFSAQGQRPLRPHKTTQGYPRQLWTICILFVLQKCGFKALPQLQGSGERGP